MRRIRCKGKVISMTEEEFRQWDRAKLASISYDVMLGGIEPRVAREHANRIFGVTIE